METHPEPKPSHPAEASKPKRKSFADVARQPPASSAIRKGNNAATSSTASMQKEWFGGQATVVTKKGKKVQHTKEKLKELSEASSSSSSKQTQRLGQLNETGKRIPQTAKKIKEISGASSTNSRSRTQVSRDLKEKKERKSQEANEKWENLTEAVKYLKTFLQKNVPTDEIKGIADVKELKSLHNDLGRYLKGKKVQHTKEKLKELSEASSSSSSKQTQRLGQLNETGKRIPQPAKKIKEISGASSTNSRARTQVSRDLKEKKESKSQEANEKWKNPSEAVKYLKTFLEKNMTTDEIKGIVDAEELKSLHSDLARYLKGKKVQHTKEKLKELSEASSSSSLKQTQRLGQLNETGKRIPQPAKKIKEISGASSTNSRARTQVSRDLKEKKESKRQEANEKWKNPSEAVKYLKTFLEKKMTMDEIKGIVDIEELKSLHSDLARYLEDEKTSNVSATIEVSSKSDGCEQLRRQKIGENLEFLPDKKICESRKEGIIIIFDGNYKVRGAVKRLPKADYDVDANKIKLLTTQSQYLPNVVRYYGMECDDDQECFYLVTEQQNWGTTFNLDELIKTGLAINTNSFEAVTKDGLSSTSVAVLDDRLEAVKNIVGDFNLIPENGGPIPDLSYTLLREVLYGLVQLNDTMEISHGDLKPENILLIRKESSWRVRLSDIDIRKKPPTKSYNKSCSYLCGFIPGHGTSDWLARNDRGVRIWVDDMYAFGKLFSYCITGKSEFGDWRTVTNKRGSSLLNYPEAYHLHCCLSSRNPADSLTAKEALRHPHFWDPGKKLAFLCDSYNKVYEFEHTGLLKELDSISWKVIEGKWKGENVETWNKRIDGAIIDYAVDQLRKYSYPDSTYKYKSFPELLRFIRHMFVHYGRHPQNIQESIGSLHKGFYDYFESKFPNLLIEVYKAVKQLCGKDEYFCRYFQDHN